jgi:hypothetical protein
MATCASRTGYRVVVRGRLGEQLSDAFEGVQLESGPQAQLHGILERLRELGLELVSVNPLDATRERP